MLREGTVLEGVGGRYRVRLDGDDEVVEAALRGRLKKEAGKGERVLAGDRVQLRLDDAGTSTIEEVLPRRTELARSGPGGRRPKRVAANVDRILVVLAAADPPFRRETGDRFLALAESSGVSPVLILNKVDLIGDDQALRAGVEAALELYREVGYPVITTSALTGEGIDDLRALLSSGSSVLVGPSGVGKSSLLNALDPSLDLRTREVSARAGRGRHTTVSARLLPIAGDGWVVDTPGFSDVTLWGVAPDELSHAFPDLDRWAPECRFRSCRHLEEPGCAVKAALERGEVDPERYRSYRVLLEEAEAAPTW